MKPGVRKECVCVGGEDVGLSSKLPSWYRTHIFLTWVSGFDVRIAPHGPEVTKCAETFRLQA